MDIDEAMMRAFPVGQGDVDDYGRGFLVEDLSKRREDRVGLGDDDAEAFLRVAGDAGAPTSSKPRGAPPTTVRDPRRLEELVLLLKRMTDDAFPDNPEKAGGYACIILFGFLNPSLDRFVEMLHGKKGCGRASLYRLRKKSEQRLLEML
jgi:hypothetical protein